MKTVITELRVRLGQLYRYKYIYKIFMIQAALSFIRNETFEKAV